MRTPVPTLLILLVLMSCPAGYAQEPTEEEIGTVQVLTSEEHALAAIFPDADSAHPGVIALDSARREALRALLGRHVRDSAFVYFDVFAQGRRAGTAVIAEERGKYRPITFMAGVDTALRIVDARVLVYRESRGGEVQRTRFLKQYPGKSLSDPIRINRDIINITGATISVNALNAGIRKVLAVAALLHPPATGEGGP